MSDSRFASLKTDPRFRRPKKHHTKVVLDDRFKELLGGDQKKERSKKKGARKIIAKAVDKYGRTVSETQEKDDLRRFYRLEAEDGAEDEAGAPTVIDYARGAVLMESSDEEENDEEGDDILSHSLALDDSDSDSGGFVSLGADDAKPEEDEEDVEVDLDENTIAVLDAQVAEYTKSVVQREASADVQRTRRLAVVNLDWDYVRAVHLYKICSSVVSATAPVASTSTSRAANASMSMDKNGVNLARGKILSVRVYPSEFGKNRMAKEEKEGPPTDVFQKKNNAELEKINEKTLIEVGTGADYDEHALRKYQLERLRYYYAIVECDTVEAAAHIYNELEGTELERSANVLDLSFVPDGMTFDDEPRDEATQPTDAPYRAVEFVTDALRHSKVKLTWDEDDPERHHILRRPLTKKEMEESDFRAYIASPSSEGGSEDEDDGDKESKTGQRRKGEAKTAKKAERDKLRALLLGGNDEELPEGWGDAFDDKTSRKGKSRPGGGNGDSDVDMEVTFMPGLSEAKKQEDENTLEKYQRKMKEKRKMKKEEARKKRQDEENGEAQGVATLGLDDEFFGVEGDSQNEREERKEGAPSSRSGKRPKEGLEATESSKTELALLATSGNPHGDPAHFDMKAVLQAEKQNKKKSRRKFGKRSRDDNADNEPGETQDDFVIDLEDNRFAAIHEDHRFAIDPTNPQFKKTKSMSALLSESSKRRKSTPSSDQLLQSQSSTQQKSSRSLQSLVASVKQKNNATSHGGLGKRRKLGKS